MTELQTQVSVRKTHLICACLVSVSAVLMAVFAANKNCTQTGNNKFSSEIVLQPSLEDKQTSKVNQ